METVRLALVALLISSSAFAAELPIRPDDKLTPGEVLTTDRAKVCRSGYSATVRKTTAAERLADFRRYGLDPRSGRFEDDHRVPLSLGGADTARNRWPQSLDTYSWNALSKDKLEDRIHAMVCSGRMSLRDGQAVFLGDWTDGYRRYFGVQ